MSTSRHKALLVASLAVTALASGWLLGLGRSVRAPVAIAAAATTASARTPTEPIRPLTMPAGLDAQRVALGARLFRDPRLSRDGTIACVSCHDLAQSGADRVARSKGIGGAIGAVNAPTVYNSGQNPFQFWDGRADSLEAQIDGPLTHPAEMGSTWPLALAYLAGEPTYVASFAVAYPDGLASANVKDAIASFERSLVTLGSRFDRFLGGDATALDADEIAGYRLFKSYGCASCHQGANVGGNMFQVLGVMGDYFADRGRETTADLGRYNVTHRDEDRHKFRVPSLRLAALTPPYFHDGSAATLEDAIDVMAKYQLGREIPRRDRALIVAFLKVLPGEMKGAHGDGK